MFILSDVLTVNSQSSCIIVVGYCCSRYTLVQCSPEIVTVSSSQEVRRTFHRNSTNQILNAFTGAPGRPVTHRRGKGWRGGYLLSAAEQYLKIELSKNFRVSFPFPSFYHASDGRASGHSRSRIVARFRRAELVCGFFVGCTGSRDL